MTPRILLNLLLAVMLAGLIALAIFEPGKTTAPATVTLITLKQETVQKIRVQRPGKEEIFFEKINNQWEMKQPFTAAANQERLAQLLKIISTRSLASYPIGETDTKQLGLDTPSLQLTFNDTRLEFGGTTALGSNRYVRINDTVHLISDRYSHLVGGVATNLLSPTLLTTNDQIIGLKLPALNLTLENTQWRFVNDNTNQSELKNSDHLQQLLDEWRHARAHSVQKLDANLLNESNAPTETITVTTRDSSLKFNLLHTEDDVIFQRSDLGLQYHFSPEAGKRLLTLPQANDA